MDRAGATIPVQSVKACVVYDPSSGRIHHEHRVLTLTGGREPDDDEVAADALRAVRGRRRPPEGSLDVLHLRPNAVEVGKRYRVDVAKKALLVE